MQRQDRANQQRWWEKDMPQVGTEIGGTFCRNMMETCRCGQTSDLVDA